MMLGRYHPDRRVAKDARNRTAARADRVPARTASN